ncbi:MAG TPA: ATP-binding protein [Polyangiaceae bacterium]|nr:ATP-binding protein [Polyangiaceae bacterium]
MPSDPPADDWFRQVLDTAPDAMIVVGPDQLIRYANAQAERLFGYPRGDLLGSSVDRLIPERLRAGHVGHVGRFFANPTLRPMGSGIELHGRHASGADIAIEVSLSPVKTAEGPLVSAAIRDISERRRADAAVKLSADRLASAVETIQDALALFDADCRLVLANSMYRRLLDGTEPIVGKTYSELLELWMRSLAFASEADRAKFREDRLRPVSDTGSSFEVKTISGRTLRANSRRTAEGGTVQIFWDLTEDVRLTEEVSAARAVAEAASAAKSEFLSSMSHELRTPLNAILGFAQLLRRDRKEPLSERHKDRVDEILKGGEHLLRLIDDILDLSRIEAGAISLSIEPVSVEDVVREAVHSLESMASRAGLVLQTDVATGVPLVAADRTRLSQILMNYGSNAIKYNRPGGSVTFRVSPTQGALVRLSVSDTGVGIAADKQDKLFQPFQRAGQEASAIEGTGIGLVITKRLAEAMQGRVGFTSTAGSGSEFWVDVPVHHEPVEQGGRRAVPEPALRSFEGVSRRVLYVEDNPANMAFMRDLLGGFDGIELVTAPTAEMGIELARTRPPDAIILDVNLPGMSGLEALTVLQRLPETKSIPVIALTAAASERDKHRGLEAGFFRYLTKPVKVDELETALETVFGDR